MKRTPEQWRNCDPNYMAANQSSCAISHALADAKADILELVAEVERLRAAAVPARKEVPAGDTVNLSPQQHYAIGWNDCRDAMLAAARRPPTASVQACRPEDRAMLQTDAGREMAAAAVAAMEKPAERTEG